MSAIVLLLVVAVVSLLISRIATVALTVTGLPRPVARFQSRSALTGAGFTTSESEAVVNHPVRRRIVMGLMLVGNLGLATAVAGVLGGFLRADAGAGMLRATALLGGLVIIYWISKSTWVDRRLSRAITRLLRAHTQLRLHDFERLLHLAGGYSVKETLVEAHSWLAGRQLGDVRLHDEGVTVLGVIRQDGTYLPVPDKATVLESGDGLIVYGHDRSTAQLGNRPRGLAGDRAHEEACAAHRMERSRPDRRAG